LRTVGIAGQCAQFLQLGDSAFRVEWHAGLKRNLAQFQLGNEAILTSILFTLFTYHIRRRL
jgi:hypothetical protein